MTPQVTARKTRGARAQRPFAVPVLAALLLAAVSAIACSDDDSLIDANDMLDAPPIAGRDAGAPNAPSGSSSSSSSSSSGGRPGVTGPDASPGPTCDVLWALTAPEVVAGLPPTAIRPSFTGDERTAYFIEPATQYKVYAATRASIDEPFGAAVELGSNVNGSVHALAVMTHDSGLELLFNRFDGVSSQIFRVTRNTISDAFGAESLFRGNAVVEVPARDLSVRFFARNVPRGGGETTVVYQLRPADAPEEQAVLLADGVPLWFESESGTLWLEQYFEQPTAGFYPRTAHWDGETWGPSLPSDLRVYWTTPDRCRLYGVNEQGIVMRRRVPPP